MFKPALDNLCPSFVQDAADFSNLCRFETMIESKSEIVQPHLAFMASFKYMDMDPFRQIIAVEGDSVSILDEHGRHGPRLNAGAASFNRKAPQCPQSSGQTQRGPSTAIVQIVRRLREFFKAGDRRAFFASYALFHG
jgi:hypothetical protein